MNKGDAWIFSCLKSELAPITRAWQLAWASLNKYVAQCITTLSGRPRKPNYDVLRHATVNRYYINLSIHS